MSAIQALILGIVQGLTEFLPISSSGHLVIFQKLFGLEQGVLTFDIALHLATLIAVVTVLWKDVLEMIKKPFSKLTLLVVVGCVPAFIFAVLFDDFIEKAFESAHTLGFEFLFTGLILWYAEKIRSKGKKLENTTFVDAGVIGVAQAVAILPAVSRSGLTLAGALFRGLDRKFALRFSFLLSIPAILGAAAVDVFKAVKDGNGLDIGVGTFPLIVGMVAAAVSGYFAVKFMLQLFEKRSMKIFAYYVFIAGGLIILEQLVSGRIFGRLW